MTIDRESFRRIDQSVKYTERKRRNPVDPPSPLRAVGGMWFYTTASGGTASRSGTTKSNSKLTLGTVTAVPCLVDSSGNPYPDVNAATYTLTCGVIPTTSPTIASDRFVYAVPFNGRMMVVLVAKCS